MVLTFGLVRICDGKQICLVAAIALYNRKLTLNLGQNIGVREQFLRYTGFDMIHSSIHCLVALSCRTEGLYFLSIKYGLEFGFVGY